MDPGQTETRTSSTASAPDTSARARASGPSRVVFNRAVGPGWYLLGLKHDGVAHLARPGQFVQVRCSDGQSWDPLLGRPFSIYSVDRSAGTYEILYTAAGRGTRWMANIPPEAEPDSGLLLDVEGPFGNSFTPPGPEHRVYLVGGGVGVAPLYFFAREIIEAKRATDSASQPEVSAPPRVTFCMGARRKAYLTAVNAFRRLPIVTRVATDDGSEGHHGFVTALLEDLLRSEEDLGRVRVYGCGPQGMNESLRRLLVERGVWGEICLESLMACGFGICFGCVAPIRKEVGGPYYNRRVCWDGPVFDARLLHPGIEG